jgi:RNA recognition motif-containing protein
MELPMMVTGDEQQVPTSQQSVSAVTQDLTPQQTGKLFVGQVPAVCSEEMLFPVFQPYGEIAEIKIMRDAQNRSKGCAWVRYKTQAEAQRAIEALHEKHAIPPQTNMLQVRYAQVKPRQEGWTHQHQHQHNFHNFHQQRPYSRGYDSTAARYPQMPQPQHQQQTRYVVHPTLGGNLSGSGNRNHHHHLHHHHHHSQQALGFLPPPMFQQHMAQHTPVVGSSGGVPQHTAHHLLHHSHAPQLHFNQQQQQQQQQHHHHGAGGHRSLHPLVFLPNQQQHQQERR